MWACTASAVNANPQTSYAGMNFEVASVKVTRQENADPTSTSQPGDLKDQVMAGKERVIIAVAMRGGS
jgi:hypothetical protein